MLIYLHDFFGAIERYLGSDRVKNLIFEQKELNKLAYIMQHELDNKRVIVDLNDSMFAIPLVVEISRNPAIPSFKWTKQAWHAIVSYRTWAVPPLEPSPYRLMVKTDPIPISCTIRYATRQYNLLSCTKS